MAEVTGTGFSAPGTVWLSACVGFLLTFVLIPVLRRLKAGQVIQEDGPQAHRSKAGTPTMGGVAIVPAALAIGALFAFTEHGRTENDRTLLWAIALLVIAYGAIGAADDVLTIRPRGAVRGLSSKVKFALQFVCAALFVWFLAAAGELHPTVKTVGGTVNLGWTYAPLAVLGIAGMANFVNITDGLDGLAAGLAVILALALAAAAIILGDALPYPNFALLYCSLAGAALGFLWFNVNPAEVFMGDAGSLAIGALTAALAIVMELEMVTVVAGMIFIADGMSSALQWAVFKYTRIRTGTGKRLWRMSPIHHHYELCGVPEPLIVARFWILGLLCAAWALMIAVARAWLGR